MSDETRAPPRHSRAVAILKVVLAVIVTAFALQALVRHWSAVQEAAAGLEPRWGLIALSCVLVLANYLMLADVWRRVAATWGQPVPLIVAFRLWCVSSLGRYVPGKVWQIGALAMLARGQRLSATAAVGSALIVSAINTAVGFAVVAVFGAHLLAGGLWLLAGLAAGVIALLFAPRLLPWALRTAGRIAGREVPTPRLDHATVLLVVTISFISWVAYGVTFYIFSRALYPELEGSIPLFVAVYTFSYLLGFLALFAPGGLVVREVSLSAALVNAGLPEGEAIVIALASRLWLTVLEITPALLFLLHQQLRRPHLR